MQVPDKIDCVDCGQPAYLLSHPPEDGWEPGDFAAYRCSGCNDRWDLVVEDSDQGEGSPYAAGSRFEEALAVIAARRQTAAE